MTKGTMAALFATAVISMGIGYSAGVHEERAGLTHHHHHDGSKHGEKHGEMHKGFVAACAKPDVKPSCDIVMAAIDHAKLAAEHGKDHHHLKHQ